MRFAGHQRQTLESLVLASRSLMRRAARFHHPTTMHPLLFVLATNGPALNRDISQEPDCFGSKRLEARARTSFNSYSTRPGGAKQVLDATCAQDAAPCLLLRKAGWLAF